MPIADQDNECIHGIYPRTSCSICNRPAKPSVVECEYVTARFAAKYAGKCYECREEIVVGDMIVRTSHDRYLCDDCSP